MLISRKFEFSISEGEEAWINKSKKKKPEGGCHLFSVKLALVGAALLAIGATRFDFLTVQATRLSCKRSMNQTFKAAA